MKQVCACGESLEIDVDAIFVLGSSKLEKMLEIFENWEKIMSTSPGDKSSVDTQIEKLLTNLSEKGKLYVDDSMPGLFRKIAWAGEKGKSVIFIPTDDSKIRLRRFHDGTQDFVGDFTKMEFANLDLKTLLF